jgi:hypothetical protein
MRSKKLLALAVTGAFAATAAYAATFEGRLVCDQDPRFASSASCMLDKVSTAESGESAFGWTQSMSLTLYGQGTEDPMSFAMSEPTAAPEYYVFEQQDSLAGFEWVLGPELVDYYIPADAYYLTDASTGDVVAIYSGDASWMVVSGE